MALTACGMQAASEADGAFGAGTESGDRGQAGYGSTPPTDAGGSSATTLVGNPLCNYEITRAECDPDEKDESASCRMVASNQGVDGGATDAGKTPDLACHVTRPNQGGDPEPECLSAGTATEGEKCEAAMDCAAGLECVGNPGVCRRYCCRGVCDDKTRFCDIMKVHGTQNQRVPVCNAIQPCTLGGTNACPADQTCAIANDTGATTCVTVGPAQAGEACDTTHCAHGLTCLGQPGARQCYRLCSKSADGSSAMGCPAGERCQGAAPLFSDPDIGVCRL